MGNAEFSDFDSLLSVFPNDSFDSMIYQYVSLTGTDLSSIPSSPWADRALGRNMYSNSAATRPCGLPTGRKYKPVHKKVRPVPTYMPDPVAQQFSEIPTVIPTELPIHPPYYKSLNFGSRVTLERLESMLSKIQPNILTPQEIDLLSYVVIKREKAFAFNYSEKGTFLSEYFPDYEIPTIEHIPWQNPPIPIPLAYRDIVKEQVRNEERDGRFEHTTSSYRSAMFAVPKKNGVRLVIDLQNLNAVTIRDSSLPPNVNEFAEQFLGYSMYGLLDLYSGFDARIVAPKSRPLQAFHTPIGPRQQTTLVQGYTNSVQEFQRCVRHVLKQLAHIVDNFIDDCALRGSESRYNEEPIPGNTSIRRFVWEYVQNLDLVLGVLILAGITASGTKAILAAIHLRIVGSVVALEGWIIEPSVVKKVIDWPIPTSLTELRGFLGIAGVGRRWIKGFALIAKPMTSLLRGTVDVFIFPTEAIEAFEELKHRITRAPVLIKIDYAAAKLLIPGPRTTDENLIVVGVDSSWIGAGWAVYQVRDGLKRPAIYGSCTFNEREQNYGQPKTEVYGVFRALKELRHRVWGVFFRLDHDAISLAQMLRRYDDVPNAPILRWISWIQLFDFEPHHVPATSFKAEDALSRKPPAPSDSTDQEDNSEDFLDAYFNLIYGDQLPSQSTLRNATRFLLDSLYAKFSNPFVSISSYSSIPFYEDSQALIPDPHCVYSSLMMTRSAMFSLNTSLPDSFNRNVPVPSIDSFLLGDEHVNFEYVSYVSTQSTPLDDTTRLSLHLQSHGKLDEDRDEFWIELRLYFESGTYPPWCDSDRQRLRFRKKSMRFFLKDGRLWLAPKRKSSQLPRLVIIDKARRGELIAKAHNEVGHKGRDAVYKHLSDRFYWPNLYRNVQYFIRSCIECQKYIKSIPIIPYNESWLAPLLRHFNIDCIHMPVGTGGLKYIIHAVEPTILWPEAQAVKSLTASAVARFIYSHIICRFACVPFITFDGGSEFKGEVRDLLKSLYNCTIIVSTAYHPEGNAPVERAHPPLVDAVFKTCGDAKGAWPKYLNSALFAVRVTTSRSTGYSPYYLLYGTHPVFSFDAEEITWQTLDWHTVRSHIELLSLRILQIQRRDPELKLAQEKLRQTRRRAIEDFNKRHGNHFDFQDYEEGMYVWLRESRLDETKGDKGEWTYSGPYIIHEKRHNDSFVLRELNGAILPGHVNIRRLRLFFYRPDNQTLRSSLRTPIQSSQLSYSRFN
jgi:hypothetical protein